MKIILVLLVLALGQMTAHLPGQFAPDHWLISEQYSYWTLWDPSATLPIAAYAPGVESCNAVDRGQYFLIAYDGEVKALGVYTPPGSLPVLAPLWYRTVAGWVGPPACCLDRGRLWMLRRDGLLMHLRRDGSSVAPVFHADVFSLIGIPTALDRRVSSVCTDGREIYFSISVTSATTHHVFAIDLAQSPPQARALARLPTTGGAIVPRRGAGLAMGPDGKIMVLDQELKVLDPRSGSLQTLSGAYWASEPSNLTYWNERQQPFAYNVWNGTAIAGDGVGSRVFRWDGTSWTRSGWWLFRLDLMTSTSPDPFTLFGTGCLNGRGLEPRLGWRGLPRQGQSFEINLRNAEPNGVSLFWLGVSDTLDPGFGALPTNAAPFGAPDCYVRVSNQASWFALVDAAGRSSVSIPVPVNPALAGFECFVQSASSSTGNALGFAASDAVAVRIR